jgi:hypothetical protein
MGGGCTHVTGALFVVALWEATGWEGSSGFEGSWAPDVPAKPNKNRRAMADEVRMRVWLFTAQIEAYHCFRFLWQRVRLRQLTCFVAWGVRAVSQ